MKHLLADGVAGFILAVAIIFVLPLLLYGGNAATPGGIAAFPYILLVAFLFLLYSRTPFYRWRHEAGTRSFAAALAAFLAGAAAGYGAILFAAAFSVTQWNPAW